MASESFDILTEFGFTMEPNNEIYDMDNILSDLPQELCLATKTSPFHESDSGVSEMSEDFNMNPGSVESTGSEKSGKMLDDLVESLEFSPFLEGSADKDLMSYIHSNSRSNSIRDSVESFDGDDKELHEYMLNSRSRRSSAAESTGSDDLAQLQSMVEMPNKENKIINYRKTRSASKGKTMFPKIVLKPLIPVPCKTNQNASVTVYEDKASSGVKSIKVLKVIKASTSVSSEETAAEVAVALDDRNRKNAINAKMNREKKKAYIGTIEQELALTKEENQKLKFSNEKLLSDKMALEEQVQYFKSVLANQSTLSKVLDTMENLKGVRLSSSITNGSRKRSLNYDHTYDSKSCKTASTHSTASGSHSIEQSAGVCLHVHDDTVSLEFCSHCANNAKSAKCS